MLPFLPTYSSHRRPLGFPMLDKQARVLDTLLKALPTSKEHMGGKWYSLIFRQLK